MAAGILRSKFAAGLGRVLGVLVGLGLMGAGSAQAIPYFNGPGGWGFDNSSLGLGVQQVVYLGDVFTISIGLPGSGTGDDEVDIYLESALQQGEDRGEPIDRVVKWSLQSADSWEGRGDLLIVFTGLIPSPDGGYENATIDIDLESSADLQVAGYGPYFFLGFVIGEDELQVGASRTFRVTMDQPQGWEQLPSVGVAATTQFVPEPGTAVLLGFGLLGLSARRRCGRS